MYVAKPPDVSGIPNSLRGLDGSRIPAVLEALPPPAYIHWDKLRHLDPPDGITHEEWWWSVKWRRAPLLRQLPLTDPEGRHFAYALPDDVLRLLHHTDQRCSGEIAMPSVVTADDQARQHYLVSSLMEEAIRSSQLEGATTSRQVAKELLRTGRPPRSRSERMILNNYRAIHFMREEIGATLTPEVVLELQRILTTDTLDEPDGGGRLQRPDEERVAVYDVTDGTLIYRPPPADQLPARLARMCEFANAADDPERFMHPVVRAVLLHFWLAYDHPFVDGNGRTARALFYWSMRTQGYWLAEYLSVSAILRKAPAQYARSFVLTETDDRDTTHFLIYQLTVIKRAIEVLHTYLGRKARELKELEGAIKRSAGLNHRQLALLRDAVRNQNHVYTFRSHATSHNVTHETGRRDLLDLYQQELLTRTRAGRGYAFSAAPDLTQKLRDA
jgi:Fic family protein